jgi:hypothetical protein
MLFSKILLGRGVLRSIARFFTLPNASTGARGRVKTALTTVRERQEAN